MRLADLFTGGGYSKALEERDKLASSAYGSSGYTNAQTQAMRMAADMAKSRIASKLGEQMSGNQSIGERLANSNVSPEDNYANMFHEMDTKGVEAAEDRIAQQLANAKNAQAAVGRGVESLASGLDAGLKAGLGYYKQGQAKRQAVQSMKENEGKNGMPSNLPPLQK